MLNIVIGIFLVLAVIYFVPFIIYASLSPVFKLKIPKSKSPSAFLLSVFISKIGTAIAFVLLYYFAKEFFQIQWLLYAGIWWIMFVLGEVSQPIGGNYSWKEAVVGVVSETVYLPLSVYILKLIL